MNVCIISGRLATAPDLRTTPEGRSVCSFRVAIRRNKEETDFFSVVTFNGTAETVFKYFKKGDIIEIQGKMMQRRWQKNGENHERVEIVGQTVCFPLHNSNDPGAGES